MRVRSLFATALALVVLAAACGSETTTRSRGREGSDGESGEGGDGASVSTGGTSGSGARASTGGTNGGATSAGRGGTDQPEGGSASGGESEGGSSALGGSEGAGRGNGGSIVVGGTGGMGGGAGRRGCMGDELPLVPSGTSPCGFALPDAAFDFVRINVWLGNTMLCSAYASDCVPNGWQFSASIDEIILCDDACRAFEATPDAMVTAELGCATVVCD